MSVFITILVDYFIIIPSKYSFLEEYYINAGKTDNVRSSHSLAY
jgi:hypothetical protein